MPKARQRIGRRRWRYLHLAALFAVLASILVGTTAKACSFAGSTVALMADGLRKPIEDTKVNVEMMAPE